VPGPAIRLESRETPEEKQLREEALDRLQDCTREKSNIRSFIEEAYYFTAPRRIRQQQGATSTTRPGDADELQTSLGMEVADDFVTEIIESFTPPESPWAERKSMPLDDSAAEERLNDLAKKEDEKIFSHIRASNYYSEKGKTAVPDLAIGVLALHISDPGRGLPIQVLGVPIRELEIGLGPEGRIDDRWWVRTSKLRNLPALLPGIELPPETARKKRDEPNKACTIKWGWWRRWENIGDHEWQHVIFVDDELVHHARLKGEGSCPLVVGRFGATPDFAWPDGPTIKCLPDYRQHDELRAAVIENVDFSLRPPVSYEDDGVINLEGGVEPGMAYPKRQNGGRQIFERIYEPASIDAALLDEQNLIQRIRRMHYVDFPEQKGKTPPSASQWLDEMVIRQRRIGTPGYSFWREEPYETFQRFRYLLEKRGIVKAVESPAGAALQPYNPAQRAHENQEVLTGTRLLQICATAFPQTLQVSVDDIATMQNFQRKLGDKIVKFRDPEQLKQAVDLFSQLGPMFGPRSQGGLPASTGNATAGG
jgi:hypothetical protein